MSLLRASSPLLPFARRVNKYRICLEAPLHDQRTDLGFSDLDQRAGLRHCARRYSLPLTRLESLSGRFNAGREGERHSNETPHECRRNHRWNSRTGAKPSSGELDLRF